MGTKPVSVGKDARTFTRHIEQVSGTKTSLCYQCGKCSAGCPVAFAMDYTPRQVIRLLQLGLTDEALKADSVWICASCDTCSSRCPRGVDIAALMDAMRREALQRGIITDKEVDAFNKAFLGSVRRFGRVHETGLILEYNLRIMRPLKDAELGLPMLLRGKISPLPERIKNRKAVQAIFERAKQLGGEHECE